MEKSIIERAKTGANPQTAAAWAQSLSKLMDAQSHEADVRAAKLELEFRRAALHALQHGGLPLASGVVAVAEEAARHLKEVESAVVLQVYEDVFDGLIVDDCEALFDKFTEYLDSILEANVLAHKARLAFLRICNNFLSRLSQAEGSLFRGKVLIMMANYLPLDERSGLNLKNSFNNARIFTFEDKIEQSTSDGLTDFNFYRTLWGLQEISRNPSSLAPEQQLPFIESVKTVLSSFESHRVSMKDSAKDDNSSSKSSRSNNAFYQYLTSSRLMKLQLSDPKFRTHILLQLLIVFQYVLSTDKIKKANLKVKLSEATRKAFTDLQDRCEKLLEQIHSGSNFVRNVRDHLGRESFWMTWKDESCPSFVKPPSQFPEAEQSTDVRIDEFKKADLHLMGSEDLASLWKDFSKSKDPSEGYFSGLDDSDRQFLPNVEDILQELKEDEEDADVEEEDKKKHVPKEAWKLLRLLQRVDINLFSASEGSVPKLIDDLYKKGSSDSNGAQAAKRKRSLADAEIQDTETLEPPAKEAKVDAKVEEQSGSSKQ